MKVWVKLLIGSALGLSLGFFLPADNHVIAETIERIARFSINIGRYAVPPLILFSMSIASYELRQEDRLWRMIFRAFFFLLGAAAVVVPAGIIAVTLFPPSRIPIIHDEQVETVSLYLIENLKDLFPPNMFQALVTDGVYLLPICVFAFFLGMGLTCDKAASKPVVNLTDALSRVFYHIASFFSEFLGVVLIALSAYWAFRYRAVAASHFKSFLTLLTLTGGFLCLIVFPLLLYLLKKKPRPWSVLYSSISTGLTSFLSGDINFTLPLFFKHTKESLGVRRRVNASVVPVFAVFGRAGSAMVAAMAFIVVIKSYSSLGISAKDIFSIGFWAFLLSLVLARHPGDGAYAALAALCSLYGRGFESGYLNLKPVAFYLIAVGTFIDVMIMYFAVYAFGKLSGLQEDKPLRLFI